MDAKEIVLGNRVMLAPLAGVADAAFRAVCRLFGAGPFISEMVSAHGVAVGRQPLVAEQMALLEFQRPLTLQLVGNSPEMVVSGAKTAIELKADAINLNMACPARKIVNSGKGCALMKDPGLAREILAAAREAVPLPLTLKIRAGWSGDAINAVLFAEMAQEAGLQAVILHPRTGVQQFTGRSNWDVIRQVKQAVSIPVVGNGDIKSPEDALRMIEQTGCDAVMIGRGSYGKPWIFQQVLDVLRQHKVYPVEELVPPAVPVEALKALGIHEVPTAAQLEAKELRAIGNMVLIQTAFSATFKPEYVVCREVRKHLLWYTKGLHASASFRATLPNLISIEAIHRLIETYFFRPDATSLDPRGPSA